MTPFLYLVTDIKGGREARTEKLSQIKTYRFYLILCLTTSTTNGTKHYSDYKKASAEII